VTFARPEVITRPNPDALRRTRASRFRLRLTPVRRAGCNRGVPWAGSLSFCGVLLAATTAFAHRPYERVAGTFQRADGTVISIVRHHVDGIIAADPVSIRFRLPDGTEVMHTPYIFDAIARPVTSGIEIYQFRTTWLPIASRVDLFDGYQLKDITSSRRANSLVVHFAGHWVGYLVAGGFAALFVALYFGLRAMPKRGSRAALRRLGITLVGVAGFFSPTTFLYLSPFHPWFLPAAALLSGRLFVSFAGTDLQPSADQARDHVKTPELGKISIAFESRPSVSGGGRWGHVRQVRAPAVKRGKEGRDG
jgi:hypothetical protein